MITRTNNKNSDMATIGFLSAIHVIEFSLLIDVFEVLKIVGDTRDVVRVGELEIVDGRRDVVGELIISNL